MKKFFIISGFNKVCSAIGYLLLSVVTVQAQTDFAIGSGTAGNNPSSATDGYPCPLQDYYEGSRAQYLYLASELSAAGMNAGNINAVKFTVVSTDAAILVEGFTVKITSTAANTLSGTSWMPGAAVVFGPVDYKPVQGVNSFTFSASFYWNGTDNIVVEVCNGGNQYSNNPVVTWTTGLGFNGSHTYRADNAGSLCNTTNTANSGNQTTRPNIIFNWSAAAGCSGTPTAGTISTSANNLCLGQFFTLQSSGAGNAPGLTYQWQSSPDSSTWSSIAGADALSYTGTQSAGTYYRFAISCGTATAYTASIFVTNAPPISGTYTINSAAATGGTNFHSFNDAYNYIKCGIAGPVVFNVLNGPYNEQLNMTAVAGASAVNTITFQGNGKTIGFAATNTNARAIIKLDSVRYVTFDSLVINANTGIYGYGVQLIRNSDMNVIRNCIINSSMTAATQNFAGIVINSSDAGAVTAGRTVCDSNTFSGNTITGGYYGVTLAGSDAGANGYNSFTGNRIADFYQYGFYVTGSYNTLIEGNTISRPSRTSVADFYGIHFTGVSTLATISKNRIINPFGAAPASFGAFYGINFENVNTPATYDNQVVNNLVVSNNGNGLAYGIVNTASGNTSYFHNTISFDYTASTATASSRGFYQSLQADGIYFLDNIVSITRGGTGQKHCIYLSNLTSTIASDYNDFYISATGGSTNAIGYNGTNHSTLIDWRNATGNDVNSVSVNPVFADAANGNYKPKNAGFDNKGVYLGIDTDIEGTARSQSSPDIGAYEFVPPACVAPPTAGTTLFNFINETDTAVCGNVVVQLGLKNNSYGFAQTFQWQTSGSFAGPYSAIGSPMAYPDTAVVAVATLYYRCAVTCGISTVYSNPLKLTVNPALAGGTYTINSGSATTYPGGTNFKTFNDAKASMSCGIAGPVVFNIVAGSGPYNEQLKLDSISGTSAVNTITFNGNGAAIRFSSTNAAEKAVIKLSHVAHIILDSLVIDATGTGANGVGVQLLNNADSNTFRRCTILSSTTTITSNYAGVVINGNNANITGPEASGCDANIFTGNTISGGYYGIAAISNTTEAINNNQFTNNTIKEFYNSGIYLGAGNSETQIESNSISRPARATSASAVYGIYVTGEGRKINIAGNRIFNLFGGAATGTAATYGIYHNDADASSLGNAHTVVNNLLYNFTGAGAVYGIVNDGSSFVSYYHNTIAIDGSGGVSGGARGFYQVSSAAGTQFKNNLISITRGGSGVKHAFYVNVPTLDIETDFNDYYINAPGNQNFTGYFNGNRSTLADWKTATAQEINSLNVDPAYTNPSAANYTPLAASLDNEGTPVNIVSDINGSVRSTVSPDIGAYEFSVPVCTGTIATAATVNPAGGICLNVPVTLDIPGTVSATGLKFVWQNSSSASGPWTNISDSLFLPQYITGALATSFYRAAIICNGSVMYSSTVQVNMNPILTAGVYTINKNPASGTVNNFLSFGDAVNALSCGITGPVIFNVAADTYTEQVKIGKVPGISAVNNVTFQSANGVAASVKLRYNSSFATANYVLRLDSANYFNFKNLTVTSLSPTFGRAVEFAGTSSFDSFLNCTIVAPASTSTLNSMAAVYANALTGTNLVIQGNTITNGSTGIFLAGTNATTLSAAHTIEGNTITGSFNHGIYASFTSRIKLDNNTVNLTSPTSATSYGIYASACDTAYHIAGNKVNINNVSGTAVYGIFVLNCKAPLNDSGVIANNTIIGGTGNTAAVYGLTNNTSSGNNTVNNVIAITSAGSTSYGLYSLNSSDINYYNNSVNSAVPLTANNYAAWFSQAASSVSIKIRNNIFSNKAAGKALYINNPTFFSSDYNTLYSAGPALIQSGIPAANFSNLPDWRAAYLLDINSIVFPPAFISNINLQPDVNNPDVWAIHGRGIQIPGNSYDFKNRPRPVSLTAGVPDMGAYEFFPSALPTVLTATPVAPAANKTQTFMYGSDTVMKVTWGATAPASVSVRRYSGVVPKGLPAVADSMYFYTQVEMPGGGSYPYSIQQFYIDPWQGSIPDQHSLGLGKTLQSNAWVVGFSSTVDVDRKVITQANLDYIDKFTGLVNPYAPPEVRDRDSSNQGKRFWVGYAKSYDFTSGDNLQEMVLYLSTNEQAANVQVRINGTGYVRNYLIPPHTVKVSDLIPKSGPFDARLLDEGQSTKGISITSDVPIVAYAHIYSEANSGATMLMPVGVYGYEYYTLNSRQKYADTSAYSSFFVIADNDNTQVEITPSNPTLRGRAANVPFTVTLNKGEIYQVLGAILLGDEGYDLTGSKVKSVPNSSGKCFPIAVFAGSTRTGIGCGSDAGNTGDVIFQQIFPSQAWGKTYLTAPTSMANAPGTFMTNLYRVMVKDPATVVRRNNVALTGIVGNRYYQYESNTADMITADKPVLVAQYMSSAYSCPNTEGDGDPEMFYLSPVEQAVDNTGFYRNNLYAINENYVTMVIPTNGMNSLTIDGVAWANIPASQKFSYVHPNAPNYTVAVKRWNEVPGQSIVKSDSAFTGIVYGLGEVESYGYNMGTLVKNLQGTGSITNTLSATGSPAAFTCVNSPFRFTLQLPIKPASITWQLSRVLSSPNRDTTFINPVPNDSVIINGTTFYSFTINQDYRFPAPGNYIVPVVYSNPEIESCDHTQKELVYVQVLDAPTANFNIAFSGCSGDKANFAADSLTQNGIKVNTWGWIFHDSTAAAGANAAYNYTTAGSYSETLRTVTTDGCIGDTSKTVIVKARPAADAVNDSLVVCSGLDTSFTVLNPVAGAIYTWYAVATGGSAAASGINFPVTDMTDTMHYYLEATLSGCTSLGRTRVTVSPLTSLIAPVVTVQTVGGDSIRFTWTAVPSAAGYEVSLDSGLTFITPSSGANGLFHTVTGLAPLQQVSIIIKAVGALSCQNSVSDTVSACLSAKVTVARDFIPICSDSSATFTVQAPVPGVTYSWYNVASGGTAAATGESFTVSSITTGTNYYVEGISLAGCTSGRTKVTVTVLNQLVPPVVLADSAASGADFLVFTWSPVPGANGYEVSVNGGPFIAPSSGPSGLTHTVSGLTQFQQVTLQVRAIASLPCQVSAPGTASAGTRTNMVFIPNTFTPNGDGRNDKLLVYSNVVKSMRLLIFNQWGGKVFESSNQQDGWDGTYKAKPQPVGVYIYVAKITLNDGSVLDKKGSVNLVR